MTMRTQTANFEHENGGLPQAKMGGYLRLKLHVRVVSEYVDTRLFNFVTENLRKNKDFANPF